MAYRGQAACYGNIGERAKRDTAARKALDLSGGLPARFRYQIQVTAYFGSTATYPGVIDACNKLLAKYPDDSFALLYLALVYCDVEETETCARLLETEVRVAPSWIGSYDLAKAYGWLGRHDKRKSTLESYLERDQNNPLVHVALGRGYLVAGQFAEARRESDTASRLDQGHVSAVQFKGDVAHLLGDFGTSEREYVSLLTQAAEADRRTASVRLGWLYLTLGRFEKARAQVQASTATSTTDQWLAWVELETGRLDLAVKCFKASGRFRYCIQPLERGVCIVGIGAVARGCGRHQ